MEGQNTTKIEEKKQITLPDSFTIKLTGDFTSSGAGRNYEATLVFVDKNLTEGEATYIVLGGNGVDKTIHAKIVNGEWINTEDNKIWEDHLKINLATKDGLENSINSDEIKSEPTFRSLSYELINK